MAKKWNAKSDLHSATWCCLTEVSILLTCYHFNSCMFFTAVTFFIVVFTCCAILQDLGQSRKSPSNKICLMPSSLSPVISPLNSFKIYSPQPVLTYFLIGSLSYSIYLINTNWTIHVCSLDAGSNLVDSSSNSENAFVPGLLGNAELESNSTVKNPMYLRNRFTFLPSGTS
jgi:hypothetical protein